LCWPRCTRLPREARFTYAPGYIDAVAVQERDLNSDSDFGDTNEVVYYQANTLFSAYALTDGNGSVVERYRYDAYGGCTVLDPDGSVDADGLSDVKNPYVFTGRRLDPESGLMQYRHRCYSPTQVPPCQDRECGTRHYPPCRPVAPHSKCPRCRLRAGFDVCLTSGPECSRMAARRGRMPKDDDLVTAYETDLASRVAVVKMALREADIPFMCANDVVSTIYPVDGMAVVRFQVFRRDAERAERALVRLGLAGEKAGGS